MEQLICGHWCRHPHQRQLGHLPFQGHSFFTGHPGIPSHTLNPGNLKALKARVIWSLAQLGSLLGICWPFHASCLMDNTPIYISTYFPLPRSVLPEAVHIAGNCQGI